MKVKTKVKAGPIHGNRCETFLNGPLFGVFPMPTPNLLRTERVGDILIVTPPSGPAEKHVQAEVDAVLKQLQGPEVRNLVIDFESVDRLTTDMLGAMLRFRGQVAALNGKMCLCNVSGTVREILRFVRLDTLWPIHFSRAQAIDDVGDNMPSLHRYYRLALRLVLKWLNRRSQRHSFNWAGFTATAARLSSAGRAEETTKQYFTFDSKAVGCLLRRKAAAPQKRPSEKGERT